MHENYVLECLKENAFPTPESALIAFVKCCTMSNGVAAYSHPLHACASENSQLKPDMYEGGPLVDVEMPLSPTLVGLDELAYDVIRDATPLHSIVCQMLYA